MRSSGEAEEQRSKAEFLCRVEMLSQKVLSYGEYGENVAGNIEIVVNVSFAKGDLAVGAQQGTQRSRRADMPCKATKITDLGFPSAAVPELDREIARVLVA